MNSSADADDLQRRLEAAEAALRRSENLRRVAIASGRMGAWRWDTRADAIQGDVEFLRLWGMAPSDEPCPLSLFADRMSPEGRDEMKALAKRAIEAGEEFDGQLEVSAGPTVGQWVRWRGRAEQGAPWIINGVSFDVTEQHQAERRQTFLLKLSDALRLLVGPIEIQEATCRLLSEHLDVDRAQYSESDVDRGAISNAREFFRGDIPGQAGANDPALHLVHAEAWSAGRPVAIDDVAADSRLNEGERTGRLTDSVRTALITPLVKDGRTVAVMAVFGSTPRRWSAGDASLLEEVADRIRAAVERARVEAALRESEARFRAFVTASSDVVYRMSPDWSEMRRLDGRGFLADTVEPSAGWVERYIYDDERHRVGEAIRQAIRTRSIFELEHRVRRADGSLGWTLSRAVPILDEAGEIAEWLGSAKDVTDHKRAQERLRESEERFRQFAASSSDALWIRDADTLEMEYVSPAIEPIYGVAPGTLLDGTENWTALIVPDDRDEALSHLERARAGEAVTHEFRIRRPSDGMIRWIRDTDFPLHDSLGRVQRIGGIAEDITGAKLTAERQGVLVAELQHRTRNLIAVVKGIANDTMRETGPTDAFRVAFADRLSALSRVQGLLSRSEAEPITIGSLLRMELDALGAGAAGDRVAVEGPEVFLRPSTVQTLALALHELATNARKHGALSHEDGRLAVTWRKRSEAGERRLAIAWTETGLEQAPERSASEREGGGYGRELIEHALPHTLGARTSYALSAAGVRCTIDLAVRPGKGEP